MSEIFGGNFEKKEQIPTLEEIKGIFDELLGREIFRETRKEEDEKGLLLLEVEAIVGGEKIELEYTREGQNPKGAINYPVISKTFYDENGIPAGGFSGRKINGKWEGLK